MSFTKLCLLGGLALSIAAAQSLTIVNPDFSAINIQCSSGWALEATNGGNCQSSTPQQEFNAQAGIGWSFAPFSSMGTCDVGDYCYGDGITGANTSFNPPSFTGLPFSYAAILQGPTSVIQQVVKGFVRRKYVLSFYVGSRYGRGVSGGNQTVLVTLDKQVIGVWSLQSFTPFTLQTAQFDVASPGSHLLAFRGVTAGGDTAFFSGVSITAAQ